MDRANGVRFLRCLDFIVSEDASNVSLLFAREWKVSGKVYRVTWSTLWRAAPVVWKRGHVHNFRDFDAHIVQGADGAFATLSGAFHKHTHFFQAKFHGFLATILSSTLCSVRRVLLGTTESHLSCA